MSENVLFEPRGIHTRPGEGESNDWITPRWLIEKLGPFDLDPCASIHQPWSCARKSYTYLDDGLSRSWDHGRVWLNPPYGPHIQKWLRRLADHRSGIAVVPARTETQWFHDEVWAKAQAVQFIKGRLKFCRPDGTEGPSNAGHGSVLIAYSKMDSIRLQLAALGTTVRTWTRA